MSDCIITDWPRNKQTGYGSRRVNGTMIGAHRHAWIQAHGPIPDGLWVLHHCDNPPCINPDHLFLGTNRDNMIDASLKGRSQGQRRTHCPKGHPYDEANTAWTRTRGRNCRACNRAAVARYRRRVQGRTP